MVCSNVLFLNCSEFRACHYNTDLSTLAPEQTNDVVLTWSSSINRHQLAMPKMRFKKCADHDLSIAAPNSLVCPDR